jgi:hypothetical protein
MILVRCANQATLQALIDPVGRVELLRHLHRSGPNRAIAAALIEQSGAADWSIVEAGDLLPAWRGTAAVKFISAGGPITSLVGLLAGDARLAKALARKLPTREPLLELLRMCSLDQAEAIAMAVRPELSGPESLKVLAAIAVRQQGEGAVRFIDRYISRAKEADSWDRTELAKLVSIAVAGAVLARSRNPVEQVLLTSQERMLLGSVADGLGRAWLEIGMVTGNDYSALAVLRNAQAAFEGATLTEKSAAEEVALAYAMHRCVTYGDVAELAALLLPAGSTAYEACCQMLAAAACWEARSGNATPAIGTLRYVADLIAGKKIDMDGRMVSHSGLGGELGGLVQRLSPGEREVVGQLLSDKATAARLWWAGMTGQTLALGIRLASVARSVQRGESRGEEGRGKDRNDH